MKKTALQAGFSTKQVELASARIMRLRSRLKLAANGD
jgi:hypothetical protein